MTDQDKENIVKIATEIADNLDMIDWIFSPEQAGERTDKQCKKSLSHYISLIEIELQKLKGYAEL